MKPALLGASIALSGLGGCATIPPQPAIYADAAQGLQPKIEVASRHVPARTVQVWLPPGYAAGHRRYPVIYLHDGQNVFDEPARLSGASWRVHRALAQAIAQNRARPAILVAVWSNDNRLGEYMPQAALADAPDVPLPVDRANVAGDAYLRFLVEELKPLIDRTYRTRRGRDDMMLMGSSMGGLISAYALSRYPDVFGAAACLSTSWPIGEGFAARWYATHLPDPAHHRLYFDYGTGTEDGTIAPDQAQVTRSAHASGFVDGRNWMVREWPGDRHTESAWAGRVAVPLAFLLPVSR